MPPKKAKLGHLALDVYPNNPTFSDVVIRYGDRDDQVFHGHKIILATKSSWFHAAFTRVQFREAHDREIRLHGDDPKAMRSVLYHIYDTKDDSLVSFAIQRIVCGGKLPLHIEGVIDFLDVFEVADKYDIPKTQNAAGMAFAHAVPRWLDHVVNKNLPALDDFKKVVKRAYSLDGPPSFFSPRAVLVRLALSNRHIKTLWPTGKLSTWVVDAAKDVPEFGKDLFLRAMDPGLGIFESRCKLCEGNYKHDEECPCQKDSEDSEWGFY